MLTSITYGYEKGSTSGNENILISFLPFCPVPCPLSCSFLTDPDPLTRWSLEECFFFRVAVYMCLFVFVFVFLRKDNINDSILNSLNGY